MLYMHLSSQVWKECIIIQLEDMYILWIQNAQKILILLHDTSCFWSNSFKFFPKFTKISSRFNSLVNSPFLSKHGLQLSLLSSRTGKKYKLKFWQIIENFKCLLKIKYPKTKMNTICIRESFHFCLSMKKATFLFGT